MFTPHYRDSQLNSLDTVTQDYLDNYNWYGTLMAIAAHLPEGEDKEKIEMAITALEPEPSIKEAIQEHGLSKVIESLFYCAATTKTKIECLSKVKDILMRDEESAITLQQMRNQAIACVKDIDDPKVLDEINVKLTDCLTRQLHLFQNKNHL